MTDGWVLFLVESTLLASFAGMTAFLFRSRPATAHWLWIIVLLKFALPAVHSMRPSILVPATVTWRLFITPAKHRADSQQTAPMASETDSAKPTTHTFEMAAMSSSAATAQRTLQQTPSANVPLRRMTDRQDQIRPAICCIWILGSLIIFVRAVRRVVAFHFRRKKQQKLQLGS